jgi:hypothetical protein
VSAAMIAVHAAVAANAARAKIADAFRLKDATAPERAVPLDQLGVTIDEKVLGEFIDSGVIRGVDSRGRLTVIGDELRSPKAYYFDEVTFLASRDNKKQSAQVRRSLLIGLAIAFGLLGAGLVAVFVQR